MRRQNAVEIDRAQRSYLVAMHNLKDAAHNFSLAREAKRRADAALVEALERAQRGNR